MAGQDLLIREILKELGTWETGQDLAPEDFRVVQEGLPFRLRAMARAHIYTVDDLEHIPDEAISELARYLAGEYATTFGLQGEELQLVLASQARAEAALRFLRTRGPTYVPLRSVYF
jgi:hypothetical protein